jgi:isopenicillin-N epimerase
MVPVKLNKLDAAYYTGNLHKWLCAPKSAAFLWVRKSLQPQIRPLVISHGYNSTRADKSRFQVEFGWTGTFDPTPWLCIPKALEALSSLETGGLSALMNRNRRLALEARALFVSTPPAPDEMIGSLVSWPVPDGDAHELHQQLLQRGVEVPVFHWPNHPKRLMRFSAQHYNSLGDYQRLKSELNQLL